MPVETVAHTAFAALVVVVLIADAWLYRVRPDLLARCARFGLPLPHGDVQVDEARRGLLRDGDAEAGRYGPMLVVTIRSPWFDRFRLVRPPEILLVLDVNRAGAIVRARWLPLRPTLFLLLVAVAGVPAWGSGQFSLLGAAVGLTGGWMVLSVIVLARRASADELMSRVAPG